MPRIGAGASVLTAVASGLGLWCGTRSRYDIGCRVLGFCLDTVAKEICKQGETLADEPEFAKTWRPVMAAVDETEVVCEQRCPEAVLGVGGQVLAVVEILQVVLAAAFWLCRRRPAEEEPVRAVRLRLGGHERPR